MGVCRQVPGVVHVESVDTTRIEDTRVRLTTVRGGQTVPTQRILGAGVPTIKRRPRWGQLRVAHDTLLGGLGSFPTPL